MLPLYLGPLQRQREVAPLTQGQSVPLDGETIESQGRVTQAATEAQIFQFTGHHLLRQLDLGLPFNVESELVGTPLGGQRHGYPLTGGQLPHIEIEAIQSQRGAAAIILYQRTGLGERDTLQADLPRLAISGWRRGCGDDRFACISSGILEQSAQIGAAIHLGLDKEMGATQGHLADLQAMGEQRQQGNRGLPCSKRTRSGSTKPAGLRRATFSSERPRLGQKRQSIPPPSPVRAPCSCAPVQPVGA